MKRLLPVVSALLVSTATLRADWLIFKSGEANQVLAVELTDRAVNTVTLAGERWSVLRDVVDVPRTREANHMEGNSRHSPGWVVMIGAPEKPMPPAPPPPPPPPRRPAAVPVQVAPPQPPPETERELAPRPPPTPRPTPHAPAPRVTLPVTRQGHRFAVHVNAAVGTEQVRLGETQSFELFSEQASIHTLYGDPRQQGLELGGTFRIKGPVGVGGSVELFQNDRSAAFQASIPHPFFFDRFRELSGSESGLTNEETAAHLDAYLTKTWGPISLDVFGGPSWFFTKTELLVDVLYDEVFPFNAIVPLGTQLQVFETRPIGYNFGAAATYRVGSIFGLDLSFRYSKAETTLFVEEGREIQFDAGGLRVGAGLRFLFP